MTLFEHEVWARRAGRCARELPAESGSTVHVLQSSGGARRYVLHVPPQYDGRTETPVVVELPGTSDWAERETARSKLNFTADEYGFVLVTVEGVGHNLNVGAKARPEHPQGPDDVKYVRDVLEDVRAQLCVDDARVFATGFSRGGRFACRLASELSDQIAAVGVVSGVRYPEPNNATRPVPIVAIHGLADGINPYHGKGPSYWGTGVEGAIRSWVDFNGCREEKRVEVSASITEEVHSACSDGASVDMYTIKDGGHRYPSGCLSLGHRLDSKFGAPHSTLLRWPGVSCTHSLRWVLLRILLHGAQHKRRPVELLHVPPDAGAGQEEKCRGRWRGDQAEATPHRSCLQSRRHGHDATDRGLGSRARGSARCRARYPTGSGEHSTERAGALRTRRPGKDALRASVGRLRRVVFGFFQESRSARGARLHPSGSVANSQGEPPASRLDRHPTGSQEAADVRSCTQPSRPPSQAWRLAGRDAGLPCAEDGRKRVFQEAWASPSRATLRRSLVPVFGHTISR